MNWLNYVTLAIMLLVVVNVYLLIELAALPERLARLARSRELPQAQAVDVVGWQGLLTLFASWPFALGSTYLRPAISPSASVERRPAKPWTALVRGASDDCFAAGGLPVAAVVDRCPLLFKWLRCMLSATIRASPAGAR